MKVITNEKLRIESSLNYSGELLNNNKIEKFCEKDYNIRKLNLDGDAPKQFIKVCYFQADCGVRKKWPNSWYPYIAKTAEKWYPHESVIEYLINRIGQTLNLLMNEIKLVAINTQIRFLSKYFLVEGQKLIHGAEICGEHLGDMEMAKQIADHKKTACDLFTFEFIKDAIRSVFPQDFELITNDIVRMITFDGLVGNNNRHFYNWGAIDGLKITKRRLTFAPI